jgi:hypothetical protein
MTPKQAERFKALVDRVSVPPHGALVSSRAAPAPSSEAARAARVMVGGLPMTEADHVVRLASLLDELKAVTTTKDQGGRRGKKRVGSER